MRIDEKTETVIGVGLKGIIQAGAVGWRVSPREGATWTG